MFNCLWFVPEKLRKNKLLKDLEKIWYMISLCIMTVGVVFLRELTYESILIFLIVVFVVETILSLKLYVDIREILIFSGFLSFYLIVKISEKWWVSFIFLLSYMVIKQFVLNGGKLYRRRIVQIFISIGIALCLFGILEATSVLYERPWRLGNLIDKNWRHAYIKYFWNHGIQYNITHWTIYIIPVIALVIYAITNIKNTPFLSFVIVILSFFVNYLAYRIDVRNLIAITFIIVFFAMIIHFIKNIKDKRMRIIYVTLFFGGGIVLFLVLRYYWISIKTLIYDNETIMKSINRGGGILGNVRFGWQLQVVRNLIHYPMGGAQYDFDYAHSFWIDIAKDAGIIPFSIFIIFLFVSIVDAVKLIIYSDSKGSDCIFLPMIFLAYTIYSAIEPTIYSVTAYMPLYFMTSAAMRATNIRLKQMCGKKSVGA